MFFKYYTIEQLKPYVGKTVKWVGLDEKEKTGILGQHKGRPILPESGGVYADTVKIKLPILEPICNCKYYVQWVDGNFYCRYCGKSEYTTLF